jgi:multicomponent Na+:H+ antiporter subunit G
MTILDIASVFLIADGCLFFIAGSVGMLRLPDVFTRLHATTKADNVGWGLLSNNRSPFSRSRLPESV